MKWLEARLQKKSKEEVQYEPQASNHAHRCELCKYFVEGGKCQLVEGKISKDGWCKLWKPNQKSTQV